MATTADTDTTKDSEQVLHPVTGEVLSDAQINAEVLAITQSLQFATKAEIDQCISKTPTGTLSGKYIKAFGQHPQPRVPREEIEAITQSRNASDSSQQRASLNKAKYLTDRGLTINVERSGSTNIVAWVMQSTRVMVLKNVKIQANSVQLHQTAREILDSLEPQEAKVLNHILDQHLGIPLNHLALYAEIEESVLSESINKINQALKTSNARIHIRNGIAILGTNQGMITVIDNKETREKLFPKKKIAEKPEQTIERLQKKLAETQEALASTNERATSAESQLADLAATNTALQEANADLVATNKQLETDVQTALTMSAEAVAGSEISKLKEDLDKLSKQIQSLIQQLETKTTELTTARSETRTAKAGESTARRDLAKATQNLTAATQRAESAEEARAEIMRARGRGALVMDKVAEDRDTEKLKHDLTQAGRTIESLKAQLGKANEGVKIHPDELARLRQASKDLQAANDRNTDLGMKLKAKDTRIQQLEAQQIDPAELARLRQKVEDLTAQVAALTDNAPAPAPAATTKAPTTQPAPKTETAPKGKDRNAEASHVIRAVSNTNFENSHQLIEISTKALSDLLKIYHDEEAERNEAPQGIPQKKINELRQVFNGLQGLYKELAETRTIVSKALDKLKGKAINGLVFQEDVEAYILADSLEDYVTPKKNRK